MTRRAASYALSLAGVLALVSAALLALACHPWPAVLAGVGGFLAWCLGELASPMGDA